MLAAVLHLLTTAARTSYPWPLCWGNALWGYVAFRKHRDEQLPSLRVGALFGLVASFVLYTMPANLFTNWLCFARTPSAITSSTVVPCHLVCCALIGLCPGNALFRLLALELPYALIDSLGVLDNATTGFNYMEEAFAKTGSAGLAIAAGMTVNLAGGVVRHFAYSGYSVGAATFDDKLRPNVIYSFVTSAFYFWAVVERCAGHAAHEECVGGTRLYEILPWIAVARNLAPTLAPYLSSAKQKAA